MTTAIKRRRGTTTQHSTFTGLEGEITVDTTKDTAVIHDGSTAGGFPLLREDLSNNTSVLTSSDIGSTVQAYDADTTKNDVSNTFTTNQVISTDSSSDALRITQTGAGNALVVEDSANPDATPFVVDANGRAILGYTSSVPVLGVDAGLQVWSSFGYTSQGRFTNDAFSTFANFVKSRNTTVGGQTIVQSGDALGTVSFSGSDGTAFIRGAQIVGEVDGTPGTNDMPGRLVFSTTADGASSPTERMRIDNAGRVGIGGVPSASQRFLLTGNTTGAATISAQLITNTFQSDVTFSGRGIWTSLSTQASAFTLSDITHYFASQGTFGAGSTVTNQYGFNAASSLTGATNNYGFYSNIASGTGRYNFYAAGSADNYFAGQVGVGTTPGVPMDVVANSGAIAYRVRGRTSDNIGDIQFTDNSASAAYVNLRSPAANTFSILTGGAERMRIDSSGNVIQSAPTTAPTLSTNGTMVFNLTSNTNLRVSVRGSDGVTRTANITLA